MLNAPYMLAFIAKKKVIPHPLELTDNGLALTEGGPQRRPRTQDVRAVVGVALTASGREEGQVPPKPLLSKLVRLGRGPAAKALQTRIWLGGETNGPSIASGGFKPEGPGAYRSSCTAEPAKGSEPRPLAALLPGEPQELRLNRNRFKTAMSGARETRASPSRKVGTGTTHGADPRAPLPHVDEGDTSRVQRTSRRTRVVEHLLFEMEKQPSPGSITSFRTSGRRRRRGRGRCSPCR